MYAKKSAKKSLNRFERDLKPKVDTLRKYWNEREIIEKDISPECHISRPMYIVRNNVANKDLIFVKRRN